MTEEARTRVRAARRQDAPYVVDLRIRLLGEAAHDEPRLRLLPDARERTEAAFPVWLEQKGRLILVAEGQGESEAPVVAYAMGQFETLPPLLQHQHVGEIHECFVVPELRGQGIGRALVEILMNALTQRGAEVFRGRVPMGNEHAAERLAAMGFTPLQHIVERRLTGD